MYQNNPNQHNNELIPLSPSASVASITNKANELAEILGINFSKEKFNINEFTTGLEVELEHGYISPLTNVTNDDPIATAKIALAHLREFPDYYTRLTKLEKEAKEYWKL